MDPTDLSTEATSLEDLIAMAEAQGIHVEVKEERFVGGSVLVPTIYQFATL